MHPLYVILLLLLLWRHQIKSKAVNLVVTTRKERFVVICIICHHLIVFYQAKPLAVELCIFFQTLRTYCYPSNTGSWTIPLARIVSYLIREISQHTGLALGLKLYPSSTNQTTYNSVMGKAYDKQTMEYLIGCTLSIIMVSICSSLLDSD